jgi:CelD/BcsL family acetyltransferase involved in cellulose biosynthesis
VTSCPVIDLSGGYESYYAARSRSVTYEPARKRRALERQRGPLALVWNSPSPDHLQQLITWKSGRYAGTRDLFTDPAARQILQGLAQAGQEDCTGVLSVLHIDGQPIAINFNLVGPRGVSGWFTSYDPEVSRSSPGTTMIFALAEEAASRGITWFDLGYGQDGHKFGLANDSYLVAGGAVWASRAEQRARQAYRRLDALRGRVPRLRSLRATARRGPATNSATTDGR